MCVKNTHIHASKRHRYMRLKCLVKNIHWITAHISRAHFETNGQPYDITSKYLYVKFPRMKTLRCKGIVQNMDWTGLDGWTGLDWTVGLDWTDFNIYF